MSAEEIKEVQDIPVEETHECAEGCECHHHEEEEAPVATRVMSKGEKKARKALEKVGLVEVPHVIEFSLKRMETKFSIENPAVYKLPSTEHYVIYGEPKNNYLDAKTRQLLEQLQMDMKKNQEENKEAEAPVEEKTEDVAVEGEDNDFVPAEEDVTVLMSQANTTREKAYAALKKTKGDLVTAFFEFQN